MFEKQMKRIDVYDIALTKLTAVAFILFIITVWPAAMDLVHSIHWGWFLGAFIVFAARPVYRFYIKK